jgi:hypothetical protein
MADSEAKGDLEGVKRWVDEYDDAWDVYHRLPQDYPNIATLYSQDYTRHIKEHAHTKVTELRKALESSSK